MAYAQQTWEQEAPRLEQRISALIYSFTNPNAQYRKEYLSFDTIERAYQANHRKITKKTKHLSKNAKDILSIVVQKLLRGETVLLNSKYIEKITGCKGRQNRNILNELKGVLKIKHRKFIRVNGRIFKGYYLFKFIPAIVYELWPTEEKGNGNKLPLHIYENNKNIENIDLGSNFSENSKVGDIKTSELVEIEKEEVVGNERDCFDLDTQQKPVPIGIQRKYRIPNKRKKSTNSEKKAKVIYFNQYKEPENLAYHYPLNNEDCTKLQSKSGRLFCLTAMNEILLDMSKRVDRTFCSKAQFISYFGKCLGGEKRDAVKTDNVNFKIKANITEEDRNYAKRESFLSRVECKAHDLENRITDGFQRLSVFGIIEKFQSKLN